jgi:hypothetical protein
MAETREIIIKNRYRVICPVDSIDETMFVDGWRQRILW